MKEKLNENITETSPMSVKEVYMSARTIGVTLRRLLYGTNPRLRTTPLTPERTEYARKRALVQRAMERRYASEGYPRTLRYRTDQGVLPWLRSGRRVWWLARDATIFAVLGGEVLWGINRRTVANGTARDVICQHIGAGDIVIDLGWRGNVTNYIMRTAPNVRTVLLATVNNALSDCADWALVEESVPGYDSVATKALWTLEHRPQSVELDDEGRVVPVQDVERVRLSRAWELGFKAGLLLG